MEDNNKEIQDQDVDEVEEKSENKTEEIIDQPNTNDSASVFKSKPSIPQIPIIVASVIVGIIVIIVAIVATLGGGFGYEPDNSNNGEIGGTEDGQDTHTHAFGEWTMAKVATCKDEGVYERTCSCGVVESHSIDKLTIHTEVIDPAVVSTCTAVGFTEGKHCSVCDKIIIEQTEIPMISHIYDDKYDAQCNVCGYEREAECAHTETEVIPAVSATCAQTGLTEGEKCKNCGDILVAQQIIPIQHEYCYAYDDTCHLQKCEKCDYKGAQEKHARDNYGICTVCDAPLTIKEILANAEYYTNRMVSFEGVVIKKSNRTVYIEEYDEETGLDFGLQVYYGFSLDYYGEKILTEGNRVRITGSLQYYEVGQIYQVSDIKYNAFYPDNPDNIKKISEGHSASYQKVSAQTLLNGTVNVTVVDYVTQEKIIKTLEYGFLTMSSTKTLENLTIMETYTTDTGGFSSSDGAISITCEDEYGNRVVLRTVVMRNDDGSLVTADEFPIGAKIASVKGIVDCYNGTYQLKIYKASDIILC